MMTMVMMMMVMMMMMIKSFSVSSFFSRTLLSSSDFQMCSFYHVYIEQKTRRQDTNFILVIPSISSELFVHKHAIQSYENLMPTRNAKTILIQCILLRDGLPFKRQLKSYLVRNLYSTQSDITRTFLSFATCCAKSCTS